MDSRQRFSWRCKVPAFPPAAFPLFVTTIARAISSVSTSSTGPISYGPFLNHILDISLQPQPSPRKQHVYMALSCPFLDGGLGDLLFAPLSTSQIPLATDRIPDSRCRKPGTRNRRETGHVIISQARASTHTESKCRTPQTFKHSPNTLPRCRVWGEAATNRWLSLCRLALA